MTPKLRPGWAEAFGKTLVAGTPPEWQTPGKLPPALWRDSRPAKERSAACRRGNAASNASKRFAMVMGEEDRE